MKIKHRIIGEYATKRCFRFKKADHRYWKLINYALTWARPNLFVSIFMPVAWMLKFVFVYLANTAVLCYALIIICCCQVHDYIYWIISTENDHWHHHKFIKYEKRLRKEGKNHVRLTYQAKSLPLQHEFGRLALPWVRSNGPTDPLHISCICSIWKILHFYSSFSLNPSKSAFFHALTFSLLPKNHVVYCF